MLKWTPITVFSNVKTCFFFIVDGGGDVIQREVSTKLNLKDGESKVGAA